MSSKKTIFSTLYSILKKVLISLFLFASSVFILMAIVGGGFGEKDNLPEHLIDYPQTLIFAHRGAIYPAAENSYHALLAARDKGYNGVEIDIQLSSDQQFFLFHDKETDRLLGIPGKAAEKPLAELQSTPLQWKGMDEAQWVISLDSAVTQFRDDFIFYLDLKRFNSSDFISLAETLNAFLAKHQLYDSVIVSNAHFLFLIYLEYQYPKIITCLEGFKPPMHRLFYWIPTAFRPDFIATFHYHIDENYIDWLKANGLLERYIAFTVAKEADLEKVQSWGVKKFIADDKMYIQRLFSK